jgi:hypothetical protein
LIYELKFFNALGLSKGWHMALVVDKELIEIVQSNLLVNDILMSAVLLISVAIFFVNRKNFKIMLASSSIFALMMPLYIIFTLRPR